MKQSNNLLPIVGLVLMLVMACNKEQFNYLERSKNRQEIEETENRLDKLYYMFVGLFSNKVQASQESSPLYRSQELIAVPIWPKRGEERWLYICWLQEDRPNDLLSQEVWNFKKRDRETLEIVMYDLPDKERYTGDWRKRDPLGNLDPEDLDYYEGCTAVVKRASTNKFTIMGEPCSRNLSDVIKYVEVSGVATPDSVVLYNKMLDEDQKTLFTYEKGLHFDRQPKIFPKYLEEEE
jgi:hypothetical protein